MIIMIAIITKLIIITIVRMIQTIIQSNGDHDNKSDDSTIFTIIMIDIMIKENIIKIIAIKQVI